METKARSESQARLKRIAGQVGGVQRMLEEDRDWVDVLLQIAAIKAALMATAKLILATGIDTSLTEAIKTGEGRERRKKVNELVDVFARFWRVRAEETAEPLSSQAARGPQAPRPPGAGKSVGRKR